MDESQIKEVAEIKGQQIDIIERISKLPEGDERRKLQLLLAKYILNI